MLSKSDEQDFTEWLRTASPGAIFVYAEAEGLAFTDDETRQTAGAALRAFYDGRVDPVQKRTRGGSRGAFKYLAIKRKSVTPRILPHWLSL